jgi:cobalamin synthase
VNRAPRDNGVRQFLNAMRVPTATRFAPLVGLGIGALSGAVYWSAVQLWPSSIAVVLSILAGALLTNEMPQVAAASRLDVLSQVFYVLIKYNVLMALSAANLPFAAPPNTALWLITICGYGAGRSLLVCVMSSRSAPRTVPLTHLDVALALTIGCAPAVLLGLPGLVGLAAAVLAVIGLLRIARGGAALAPLIAELCFYLGAQASWSYI